MKRRRQSSPPGNKLRRLALAGRWDELRTLLEGRLERDPYDSEARDELERLNRGLPLRAAESALVRKRREEREMREELDAELALYRTNPEMTEDWQPELVDRRRKRIIHIRRTLGRRMSAEQAELSAAYLSVLNRQRAQHRNRRRWRLLLLLMALCALGASSTATALHHSAGQAEAALRAALGAQDEERVTKCIALADSGINRLMNRELATLITQARNWKERVQRQRVQVAQALGALETGRGSVSTLPLARRAELERLLRDLPPGGEELRRRWQRLCDKEAQALARQKQQLEQRFCAALPALPELSGHAEEDDARLRHQQEELQPIVQEWESALQLFSLPPGLGEPMQVRLNELSQLRADIAAYQRTLSLLPAARSYQQYRHLLESLTPKLYAPAIRLASLRERLPDESRLSNRMQNHGRQLPPGMLEAARHALLEQGPSFTPAFPAGVKQLQLMEDLFTYQGLHKVLYEMSAPTLPSFIVEERPHPGETSVSFTPSPLTPGFTLDTPRRITWHNPQAVYIRRIDATPLMQQTGINRESFFSKTNLPALLDSLLRLRHEECPELARAFVFKRLLEVMSEHEWPTMLGIACAPTLRADARSFARLCNELEFPLEAGCWLSSTPETARAEEACARWLHERRHRCYADEIARNFAALVQVHPRYIGHVNEKGEAVPFRKLPRGTLLWYLSEDGLSATPLEEKPDAPVAWSPLFIIAKD